MDSCFCYCQCQCYHYTRYTYLAILAKLGWHWRQCGLVVSEWHSQSGGHGLLGTLRSNDARATTALRKKWICVLSAFLAIMITLCCSIQLTKHRGLLLALGRSVVNPKESSFQVWLIASSCFWRLEHQFCRISLLNVLQRLAHSGMPDIRRPDSTKVVPRLWVPNHVAYSTLTNWVISVLTHHNRIRCESLAMPFLHNLHHVTCMVFCPAELADIWSIFYMQNSFSPDT